MSPDLPVCRGSWENAPRRLYGHSNTQLRLTGMRCGLGLGHEDMIRRCRAASQPPDETHRGCPRRAPGASRGTAREICGAVASMGCGLSVRARGSGLLVWCFWSGGGVGRPLVLLLVWSMSVRRRSEVWERWRRSPYCHSSLLWQGGADQGACGLAVGEDSGRCLLGAGSGGPGRITKIGRASCRERV